MQLYHVREGISLTELAEALHRPCAILAAVNGISPGTHLTAGDVLLVPAPMDCATDGRVTLLLACATNAGNLGSALTRHGNRLSMLVHTARQIGRQLPHIPTSPYPCAIPPTLCMPEDNRYTCPTIEELRFLAHRGYAGLALPYTRTPSMYEQLKEQLGKEGLLLALFADGSSLLTNPEMLAAPFDLLFVTPPEGIPLEDFFSDLSTVTSPSVRRKILFTFEEGDGSPCVKKGARKGRLKRLCRRTEDCYIGFRRLMHDGYGGVLTPWGRTTPALYQMLSELSQIIPASQRSGGRYPS